MNTQSLIESIPRHWKVTTLGEVCARGGGNVQTGPFGSQLHASDYVNQGIPSIMPQNIGENRVEDTGIARIRREDAERLSRYRVQTGDIVYSRRGDVEKRALICEREDGWLCGTGCLRIRFGEGWVDPRFASYYLGHPSVRQWIVRHAHGATMPNLNTAILSELPFVVPPLPEQRAIAHILGTLDDKIELNRKMNETLDEIARTLFTSWFVNFDPVRAKAEGRQPVGMDAETAALFPDRFVDSGLGPIPEGWIANQFGSIAASIRLNITSSELHSQLNYVGLEHIPKRSIALPNWESADKVSSNKSRFMEKDILFGKLRPYFHKVVVAPVDGICSTDILVLRAKSAELFGLAMTAASSDQMIQHCNARCVGTRMPRTSWNDVSSFPMTVPPTTIAAVFNALALPLVDLMQSNIQQSRTLSHLRDTLLPELISGRLCAPSTDTIATESD